ncbi:MAG TPA: hypothetical protein VJH92_04350 [Candidatus Nanoarchaeia archaeon]|nr:hypothetical protein [Candidatus Nanoarchaeia archaeon]
MKKSNLITFGIIILIVILAIVIIRKPTNTTTEEVAKCIGEKSTLYVQLGCPHCKTQEEMFGDNVKFLNEIDCFFEKERCTEIEATPTWLIDGEYYEGVQEIEKIQNLTGC